MFKTKWLVVGYFLVHGIPVCRLPCGKYGAIITIYWGKVKRNLTADKLQLQKRNHESRCISGLIKKRYFKHEVHEIHEGKRRF